MSSETVFVLERAHVLGIALLGALSVLFGVVVAAYAIRRKARARLLWHFTVQTAGWGIAELGLATFWWYRLGQRDYSGMVRLLMLVRVGAMAELCGMAIGATLALGGWFASRSDALGAGLGIVVQCAALLGLDYVLLGRLMSGG